MSGSNNSSVVLRLPGTNTTTPIPERLQLPFEALDATGDFSLTRGNGVYEFPDATLPALREAVSDYVFALGLKLTDQELQFLQDNFGFTPGNPQANNDIAKKWSDPKVFFKQNVAASEVATFEIIFDDASEQKLDPQNHDRELLLIRRVIEKIYRALGPSAQLPKKIRFIGREGFQGIFDGAAYYDASYVKQFVALSLQCYGGTFELGPEAPEEVWNRQSVRIQEEGERFANMLFITTDNELWVDDEMLKLFSLYWEKMDDAIRRGKDINPNFEDLFFGPFNYTLAHELAHALISDQFGNAYYRRQVDVARNNFKAKMQDVRVFQYCFGVPTIFGNNPKRFETFSLSMLSEEAVRDLMAIFHDREFDADLLGAYIMVQAGYPLETLLELVDPKSKTVMISHPAQSERYRRIQTFVRDSDIK